MVTPEARSIAFEFHMQPHTFARNTAQMYVREFADQVDGGQIYSTAANTGKRMVRARLEYTQATEVEMVALKARKKVIVKIGPNVGIWTSIVVNRGVIKELALQQQCSRGRLKPIVVWVGEIVRGHAAKSTRALFYRPWIEGYVVLKRARHSDRGSLREVVDGRAGNRSWSRSQPFSEVRV